MVKLEDVIQATKAQLPHPNLPQIHPVYSRTPSRDRIPTRTRTYLVIGASRGIGLEFVRQLLAQSCQVIAVVRSPSTASQLWNLMNNTARPHQCIIEQCDVSDPLQIDNLVQRIRGLVERGASIDTIILNAGILQYHRGLGSMQVDFMDLMSHLSVNCTGNVVLARKLLELNDLPGLRQERERERTLPPPSPSSRVSRDPSANRLIRNRDAGDVIGERVKRIKLEDNMYSSDDDTGSNNGSVSGGGGVNALPRIVGRQVIFISSDSGSMGDFREYEDGFAAYGASKAALNMMIRHMAVELRRRNERYQQEQKQQFSSRQEGSPVSVSSSGSGGGGMLLASPIRSRPNLSRSWESQICVLAMHPGEVATDMANINADLDWEVEGVISPEESVACMLKVLRDKGPRDSGTFWRWDGDQHPW